MAAIDRILVRGLACAGFVLAGCAQAGPATDGLYIEDAGAALFGSSTSSVTGTGDGTGGGSGQGDGAGQGGDGSSDGADGAGQGGDGMGNAGVAGGRTCQHVDAFTAHANPPFVERCVRCHDGTKGKATKKLDLTTLRDASPAAQQTACDNTLTTADMAQPANSTIFTFLDPDNSATRHDFKYPSAAEFTAYRDAVMQWLSQE